MTLLSACSDINRLVTVAATLSIGVVGVCEDLLIQNILSHDMREGERMV